MATYEPAEWLATTYLLRMSHIDQTVLSQYVHEGSSPWIDFEGLQAVRRWSDTEELMIRAAQSLWGGKAECGVGEACQERLDKRLFRTILEAMAMRRGMQVQFVPTVVE